MHRKALLTLLKEHHPVTADEKAMTQATIEFVEANPACFERTLLIGHITASALIVSPDRQQVVLIHHRKLDRWLQPGGHADGDPDSRAVAFREAEEETGLTSLKLVSPAILDVDIHPIPARGDVPEHLHYDIRFLFEADPTEPFKLNEEVKDVQWVALNTITTRTNSVSVLRMVQKIN
ncbi:NUDIX hydrolase [Spirosoma sp. SC4-14]|uniref:NUDIX hydrolase n=1 Tax=Spirosoma sp. SC4-14 TaxID=3128900 RepID=UPI0030CB7C60